MPDETTPTPEASGDAPTVWEFEVRAIPLEGRVVARNEDEANDRVAALVHAEARDAFNDGHWYVDDTGEAPE
jgi:hypothetical protein